MSNFYNLWKIWDIGGNFQIHSFPIYNSFWIQTFLVLQYTLHTTILMFTCFGFSSLLPLYGSWNETNLYIESGLKSQYV